MAKNIVVFMDGTRNKPSDARRNTHTNIYETYRAYRDGSDGTTISAYIRGVGTIRDEAVKAASDDAKKARRLFWQQPSAKLIRRFGRYVATRPEWLVQHFGASAVGWGVGDRIEEGYRFIATNYSAGDHVYIFGFSRGAYEARSLAAFIDKVGLRLKSQAAGPDRRDLIGQAYAIFRAADQEAFDNLERFLRQRVHAEALTQERRVAIHMLGVYDTVGALGAVGEQPLDRASLSRLLTRWLPSFTPRFARRLLERLMSTRSARALPLNTSCGWHAIAAHELRETFEVLLWDPPQDALKQDVRQVLFAGAHADVGGGYAQKHLSNHAQAWMLQESHLLAATTGLQLPKGPTPEPSSNDPLPHHEVTGLFALKGPKKRALLVNPKGFQTEILQRLKVHQSALDRLFDEGPSPYGEDDSEGTFPWGRRYPKKVAAALADVDGSLVRLHVLLTRPRAETVHRELLKQPKTATAADWHSLAELTAQEALKTVRDARESVATWNPRDRVSLVPDKSLVQNIATLLACGQQELCLELVGRLAAAPRAGPGVEYINAMRRLQPEFHKLKTTVRHTGEMQVFLDELDKALALHA